MILICGIASEPPVALAIAAAREERIPFVIFNQREAGFAEVCVDAGAGGLDGYLYIHETEHKLSSFTGVYSRMMESALLPENRDASAALGAARSAFLHEALTDWMEIAPCRVANRNAPSASNASKPYQARAIAEAGFATPETMITNDPDEVREFARKHGRIIYKSVSSVRSIVREWSPRDEVNLQKLRVLPTQFQERIEGEDVRVHVAGSDLHATRVRSDAVDYRYAGRDGLEAVLEPFELDADVADRCRAVSRILNLPFCGIDLRRTPQGEYYCFEANPSPAYSYYQEQTGQPIARSLVRYLAGA